MGEGIFASDGTVNRVQIGDLQGYQDPNGVSSPAEWGMRVLDSNADIIFDTVGIAAAASMLGHGVTVESGNYTNTSWAAVPWGASTPTITIANRTQKLLLLGWVLGWPSNGTGSNQWLARVDLNGGTFLETNTTFFGEWIATVGSAGSGSYGPLTSCPFMYLVTYPVGVYTPTISLLGPGSGSAFGLTTGRLLAMQLGG